jgi:hypothetical protein
MTRTRKLIYTLRPNYAGSTLRKYLGTISLGEREKQIDYKNNKCNRFLANISFFANLIVDW